MLSRSRRKPIGGDKVDPHPHPSQSRGMYAERRQLPVMFTNLVGSTALSTKLDPRTRAR